MDAWTWWMHSDAGLAARVAIGAGIFVALAAYDYARNRERATRWREYAVLLVAVTVAMIYGAVNDQLTSTVSWEYFYYGKGLSEQLGPQTPPDALRMHLAAAVMGIKATWSAGLIVGVAMLLANNPSRTLPRLPITSLLRFLPLIIAITLIFAALGGLGGYAGFPTHCNDDFAQMLHRNEMRPRRFMAAYGIHLGGYIGGLVATVAAIVQIRRRRRSRLANLRSG
jgi:Flp pilus assembly pilin Flp